MNHSQLFLKNKIYPSLMILVMILMASPAMAQQAESEEDAAAPAAEVVADKVSVKKATNELDPGMQIPVDGSSLDAFNESLETIKEQAQEVNYTSLEGAIQYLLVYDLSAGRDKAKLAKNLDGLTGDQIIDKVQWRRK